MFCGQVTLGGSLSTRIIEKMQVYVTSHNFAINGLLTKHGVKIHGLSNKYEVKI